MKKYVKLLRMEQWVKNLFVFVPLFFSGNITNIDLLAKSIVAFVIFSLTASVVYILNDYNDIEADRKHPEKRRRPLASGAISKKQAVAILIGLLVLNSMAIFIAQMYFHQNLWKFTVIIGFYFVMNIAYTFRLKHVAIVDISIIAVGFVLRVLSGGYITGIKTSQWAILLTFVLALVLAIGKRRGELINAQVSGKTRRALDGYNVQFADITLSISITLAIVCYLMFTLSPEVQMRFHERVFYTVIFVVFAFLRYLQQTLVYNRTESPTKIVYRDRYIQVTLLLWVAAFLIQIYFKK
ncbi:MULTISPECIES: decaprenyl-phosphate phosphoribosyltransferase [Chryseobacterium]|uniref:Decaprenyl-phosphate phosphoribosyltransferase n=1 Tax=Chryseobacterium camelliae TaxID=1265445 RepID=A0ABU0TJF1_9FLAO|nr:MULTISPECIES: decaprenyl-phosphate phosphoribosyltransferase [Chryseobacterium]MDT3409011.1 decaprenyl-phosphate phosphoribosyltransferase [Pseudacidovorax intermedius]MDQ1097131.1 decaprenyl-phosphate phosphoribosyltransferase [Chryseobacterium camelliae]MDQ1101068.1 decaprenyl-phosphate phosphoribosyltransferase [Chryseobacterium sp. SORGH_AS_1048]MDR6084511.1 decaprenyl-phosphate phosphoribosyltransferase [Chryseobacterium sp. SORGH_AS_0909]MDR6132781.1 decaprenyl-phosphate phosphoribosy